MYAGFSYQPLTFVDRQTYVYVPSTVSRRFGAETKRPDVNEYISVAFVKQSQVLGKHLDLEAPK